VIVEVDDNGDEFKHPAVDWANYFHKNHGNKGMTRGENVVSEFWVR
jgi:adenosine deaminase